MKSVRVRYAPSPTGIPHIGNIRTALFNYLFAKNQGGEFLLRIEDTDQNRLVPGSVEKIKESLELLGLKWDEEEHQSKRLDLYKQHLEILKDKNLAYDDGGAWRFKVEKGKSLTWDDVVHGPIKFSSDVIEDFIIIKSDGFPTYHFASVVDDHDMKISHVLRGDEWISSTPKHLLLYQSFGWDPPQFVHLPPILGADHKKLSKRQGAKSTVEYIDEGYLPEAIVNFLAFLGWSPKDDQELFSLEELTKEFSLDRINKNSPIFNLEKVLWLNGKWIREKFSDSELAKKIFERKKTKFTQEQIKSVIGYAKYRIKTLNEFDDVAGYLIEEPPRNIKILDIHRDFKDVLKKSVGVFSKAPEEKSEFVNSINPSIEEISNGFNHWKRMEVLQLISRAISSRTEYFPLLTMAEALGKKGIIRRLKAYIED